MITTKTNGPVTTLILDRPAKRNALTYGMITNLHSGIAAVEADENCRALVITGAEGHFAAGRDLGDADPSTPLRDVMEYDDDYISIFEMLRRMTKPSIAVVQGYALAGGFTLAMGCDFVIANRSAQFGALEMRGGFPAAVNTAILSNFCGPRQAMELLLSADVFPAAALFRMGLINELAADFKKLAEISKRKVDALVALDPIAVRLTKETARAASTMPPAEASVMAKQLNSLLMTSGKINTAAEQFEQSQNPND